MPRVTTLDGRVYELDEETLEKCRIPDEQVRKLGMMPPLSIAPDDKDIDATCAKQGEAGDQARHGAADRR
jgi:hypothetical protein